MSRAAAKRHAALKVSALEPVVNWKTPEEQERGYLEARRVYQDPQRFSNKQFRKWTLQYFKDRNPATYDLLRKGGENLMYFRPVGIDCRLMLHENGLRLEWSNEFQNTFDKNVTRLMDEIGESIVLESPEPSRPALTQQEKNQRTFDVVIRDLDDRIEKVETSDDTFSVTGYLRDMKVNAKVSKMVYEHYLPYLKELRFAANPGKITPKFDDEGGIINDCEKLQIREAWEGVPRKQILRLKDFVQTIVESCQQEVQSSPTTITRRPRKVKILSAAKRAEKIHYLKEFADLGMKSISPTKLFDSREAWIYNTKYGTLAHYITDSEPLTVNGSTIKGFDVKKSVQTRVKKPESTMKGITPGKRVLNKILKGITNKRVAPTGRINKDCIILAVF